MDNAQNQSEMSEPAQQLEEARDNARRASEALEEGEVSRAAAEGQRAKEQLDELRDEFQNRTSGEFTEQVRQLRNEVQDIEKDENELKEKLNELENDEPNDNSLRTTDSREQIAEEFDEQRQRVEQLRKDMKETIEEAEEFEPLLAEELYETYRQSEMERPDRALEATEEALRRGFMDDASTQERRANEGIQNLREGIERSAESVLGDEARALEIARNTIEQLRNELDSELDQNNPDRENQSDAADEREPREGQRGEGQPDEEKPREGESQQPEGQQGSGDQPSQGDQPPGNGQPQEGEEQPPGSGNGQANEDPQNDEQQSDGQPGEGQQNGQQRRPDQPGLRDTPEQRGGQLRTTENFGPAGNPNLRDRDFQPLTGEEFLDWSDRLRDVEEMVNDPELRAEASRIREKAKEVRKDFKRHSKDPNWNLVEMEIAEPLSELQKRLTEELIRKSNRDAIVPLDNDPVPVQYKSAVEKYFRNLGTGK